MRLRPQSVRNWLLSMVPSRPALDDDDEDGGEDGRAGEEEGGVLLHAPGLHLAEALAAALGSGARAVDDGVDDALVDLVVDELAALDGRRRRRR